jgi:Tol biopolymer transport system component
VGPERFLREIKTAASLQHPHILSLIDSGVADGLLYYVMPYVEGASLRQRISVEKQLGLEETMKIAEHVASALDYAHRHGVIHRDIKPENVLLHEGSALVADFGIALATGSAGSGRLTETGFALGTPQYMSPEQAAGDRELDARTDTYALGCLVYEMLTGEPPHTGATAQAIFSKTMTEMPTPIRVVRRNVPAHVEAAVERALAKVPADRFSTSGGFVEALSDPERPITGPTAHTPSAVMAGDSRSPIWSKRAVVGLSVVAILLALAWFGNLDRGAGRMSAPPTTRQVTFSGDAQEIALAPDGEMFAYLANEGRTLLLKDIGGDVELRLVDADEPLGPPRWSPDGSEVLFAGNLEDQRGIFAVARLGGDPRVVVGSAIGTPSVVGRTLAYDFAGSRDVFAIACCGAQIYLGSDPNSVTQAGPDSFVVESGRLIDLNQTVARIHTLDVSRDGERISFVGATVDQQVILGTVSTDGSSVNIIAEEDGSARGEMEPFRSPQWSLSGGGVYYSYSSGGGSNILAVEIAPRSGAAAGDPILVAPALPAEITFGVSPDHHSLMYSGGARRTRLVQVDGGAGFKRLATGTWTYNFPALCSDGTMLAYAKGAGSDQDVYARSLADDRERRVTQGRQFVGALSWSPDCSRIAYVTETANHADAYVVDVETGQVTGIGEEFAGFGLAPQWSSDGSSVVLSRERHGLVSIDLDSGAETPVDMSQLRAALFSLMAPPGSPAMLGFDSMPPARPVGSESLPDLRGQQTPPDSPRRMQPRIRTPVIAPDGVRVAAFLGNRRDAGLWLLSMDESVPRKLVDGRAWPLGWTDDDAVLFVRNPFGGSGVSRIEKVSSDNAVVQTVLELPFECELGNLTVSRQGNRAVCALTERTSDVWVVEGIELPVR